MIVNTRNANQKKANAVKNRLEDAMGRKRNIPVIVKKRSRKGVFYLEYPRSKKSQ
jgi:hypothetical protein